jgi:hypothetical protein
MNRNKDSERDDRMAEDNQPAPDPETKNTTDPQEHMKGPVSNLVKDTGHAFETNESKEEAQKRHDKRW